MSDRMRDIVVRGYTGAEDEFHDEATCDRLRDPVKALPETKALKWDIPYCPICFPDLSQ